MVTTDWTATEFSVIRALAVQVPNLTLDQIARLWFAHEDDPQKLAQHVADRLVASGLIETCLTEAHPLLPVDKPLYSWRPGMPHPGQRHYDLLAQLAQDRWYQLHTQVTLYVATRLTARLFGTFVDVHHKPCEASHNLHLAEVFVQYRLTRFRSASHWLGEAAFPKLGFDIKGMKDPDAFLLDFESGQALRIVEFVGRYSAEHLQKFHEHCAGGAALRLARFLGPRRYSHLGHLYSTTGTAYELW